MSATLKTLAQYTGLSVTTVSRALKDGDDVKEETKKIVKEAAHKLGYSLNIQALGLRTGINYNIAIILPLPETHGVDKDIGTTNFMAGLTSALETTAYRLRVVPAKFGDDLLEPIKHIVEGNLASGIIFNLTQKNDERVKYLQEQKFPFITHGRTLDGSIHSYIDSDGIEIGYLGASHLFKQGCKKIIYIGGYENFTYSLLRRKGITKAAEKFKVPKENVIMLEDTIDAAGWKEYFKNIMSKKDRPDGIFCDTEITTLGCISGIKAAGLKINEDVFVVTTESSDLASFFTPQVSGVRLDNFSMGNKLGKGIIKIIESKQTQLVQTIEKPQFIQR